MKKFNIGQLIIVIITFLLFISAFILVFINSEVSKTLSVAGAVHLVALLAYTVGGWVINDECNERLSSLRKGHRILEEYQDKKIAKQNEEIKKLKTKIKKMRTARKL